MQGRGGQKLPGAELQDRGCVLFCTLPSSPIHFHGNGTQQQPLVALEADSWGVE